MTRSSRHRLAGALVAFGLVVASALGAARPAAAEDTTFVTSRPLALTGLAADPGRYVYWAVSEPTASEVVALRRDGRIAGTMTFTTKVTSVQALAYRNGVLYLADIGDPQRQRDTIAVLRFGEPYYGEAEPQVWRFRYADGKHDAAAFVVSSKGNVYVITRGPNPGFYRAEGQPSAGATTTLRRVANAPEGVSDAAFFPNSARLAVWADTGLHMMDGFDFSTDAIGPIRRNGEAVAIGLEGEVIMLGRGGNQPRVIRTEVPTGKQMVSLPPKPTPTPAPSPTKSPSATAAPSADAVPPEGSDRKNARTGTFTAIGGAAAAAVLAGLATALIGRRRGKSGDDAATDDEDVAPARAADEAPARAAEDDAPDPTDDEGAGPAPAPSRGIDPWWRREERPD